MSGDGRHEKAGPARRGMQNLDYRAEAADLSLGVLCRKHQEEQNPDFRGTVFVRARSVSAASPPKYAYIPGKVLSARGRIREGGEGSGGTAWIYADRHWN